MCRLDNIWNLPINHSVISRVKLFVVTDRNFKIKEIKQLTQSVHEMVSKYEDYISG